MTQLELAQKLGYDSVQFVSLFERGRAKVPLETLGYLIVILRIPESKIVKPLLADYETLLVEKIEHGKRRAKHAGA